MKYRNTKGFTLVELIVVVAIIGVLAAVLVPNYIKYVEMSRTAVCANNLGELTQFYDIERAQGRTDYAAAFVEELNDVGGANALANTQSGKTTVTCTGLCPSDKKALYTFSIDSSGNISSYGCAKHGETKNGIIIGNGKTPNLVLLQAFEDAVASGKIIRTSIDSGAAGIGDNIAGVLTQLGDFDFGGLNVKSWAIRVSGTKSTTVTISDQNIDNLPEGTLVRALRYNTETENYTVVYCPVRNNQLKGNTYRILDAEKFVNAKVDNVKVEGVKDYSEAVAIYNSMPAVSSK